MDIRETVIQRIQRQLGADVVRIRDEDHLGAELGMDSLDMVEVAMNVEDDLGCTINLPIEFGRDSDPTVGEFIQALQDAAKFSRSAA